jgi:4a-hydroxytetrahydrobiopterin dehydratase
MDRAAAEAKLAEVPGWVLSDDGTKLTRSFKFDNFAEALDFVRWVGRAAEDANHHPEISFGWGHAKVTFYTHKIGGLHENDFILAARVSRLYDDEE